MFIIMRHSHTDKYQDRSKAKATATLRNCAFGLFSLDNAEISL